MTSSDGTLQMVLDAYRSETRSYTDSAVSSLEQRLTTAMEKRAAELEQTLREALDQQQREHDSDMRDLGTTLRGMSADIGTVKSGVAAWDVQMEHVAGINLGIREIRDAQAAQGEQIQTLQSDVYGTPARGRKTIFGMIEDLTTAVSSLADQARTSGQWIEAETVRQAEARQRWANRQQAALGLVKMVPVRAAMVGLLGGSATLIIILKALGG